MPFISLLMAWTWMVGGLWFSLKEYREQALPEPTNEGCSIIIPCFNEAQVRQTIRYALQTKYLILKSLLLMMEVVIGLPKF